MNSTASNMTTDYHYGAVKLAATLRAKLMKLALRKTDSPTFFGRLFNRLTRCNHDE